MLQKKYIKEFLFVSSFKQSFKKEKKLNTITFFFNKKKIYIYIYNKCGYVSFKTQKQYSGFFLYVIILTHISQKKEKYYDFSFIKKKVYIML